MSFGIQCHPCGYTFVQYSIFNILKFSNQFRSSRAENNSYCVFHYTPSVLTAKYNLSAILFPECEDPLIERPDNKPECMFAPNRLAKVNESSYDVILTNRYL